jgi:hypothetical protein
MTGKETRVVFLDMDGVCCPKRAALALGEHRVDSVAIEFLNRLYRSAPFSLVASSSWIDEYYLPIILKAVGCIAPFADAWRIEKGVPRPEAISDWLRAHAPSAEFIILDDEEHPWSSEQLTRWVRCDSENGITVNAMRQAFEIFGVKPPVQECEGGGSANSKASRGGANGEREQEVVHRQAEAKGRAHR